MCVSVTNEFENNRLLLHDNFSLKLSTPSSSSDKSKYLTFFCNILVCLFFVKCSFILLSGFENFLKFSFSSSILDNFVSSELKWSLTKLFLPIFLTPTSLLDG